MEITAKNHVSVEASIWSFWKSRQKHIGKHANMLLYVTKGKPNTRLIVLIYNCFTRYVTVYIGPLISLRQYKNISHTFKQMTLANCNSSWE